MTVAFPTNGGWMQFFAFGALLLPAVQAVQINHFRFIEDPLVSLIAAGVRDSGTGIILLPLFQVLLTVGSEVAVDNGGGLLTFLSLWQAANPEQMLADPIAEHLEQTGAPVTQSSIQSEEVFIKGGTRAGKDVGHLIPQAFMNSSGIVTVGQETYIIAVYTQGLGSLDDGQAISRYVCGAVASLLT